VGGVKHMLAVGRDVTEERAAVAALERVTAELRRSEARNRFAVRSMPVVQWVIDREGRFTLSEGQALAALGLKPGELVGRSVQEVYAGDPDVLAAVARAMAGQTFETRNVFGPTILESHWAPLRDDVGEVVGVTGVALDVTGRTREEGARKEAEARLALMERLAATGRLAAGVAHEINNPLTYVLGNLEVLLERLDGDGADPATLALLRDARDGAGRVRDIVRDLRAFARGGDDATGSCDPAAAARAALDIAGNELRHRARLETSFGPSPRAAIPERRLAQVLVNLLVNACRAIPEDGDGEKVVRVAVRGEGDGVVIEVADTGTGMTPEVQARLFEPFFTTRDVGEGMGLGLALSRAMVTGAGGEIEVESAPGRGSLFRLRIPAAPPQAERSGTPAPAAPSTASSGPAAQARPLRVLVVDDEAVVARAVARALRPHVVVVAGSAAEALAALGSGDPPDAIVCDLMMPEVTGMDLHERLAAERPELARRMIFLTGGAFTDRARAFLEQRRGQVMEKPIEGAALRGLVERVAREGGAA
jgi:PAS domain S-box-containing protein